MGVMQRSGPERSEADVKAGQTRARLDDANASTRPNAVTVAEIRKLRVI